MLEEDFLNIFRRQVKHAAKIKVSNDEIRIAKLKKIKAWILQNRAEIKKAIHKDFQKPHPEIDLTDIKTVLIEIDNAISNLEWWMKPIHVKSKFLFSGTKSWVINEPAGVVLILSPWN